MDKLVSKHMEGKESAVQVTATHKALALKIRLKNKTLSISTQNGKLNIYTFCPFINHAMIKITSIFI